MAGGILLKDPRSGEEVGRRALIKDLFLNGYSPKEGEKDAIAVAPKTSSTRGQIVKWLKRYCNHVVPFQIVFQATSHEALTKDPSASNGTGGAQGKDIQWKGQTRKQAEVIKELLKGDPENGVQGLSRGGVVAAFKKEGLELPYGSVYQISKRLKAQGVAITESKDLEPSGEGESDPEADLEGQDFEGSEDEEAAP